MNKIYCDVCIPPKELKPEEWKQIVFTDRQGLDLCQNDLNLAAFILDSVLGNPEQLNYWRKQFAEYTQQVLDAAKAEQDTTNR